MMKNENFRYDVEKEIRTGLLEYLENKESPYMNLSESFSEKISEGSERLDRENFKKDINEFILENIEEIVKLKIVGLSGYNSSKFIFLDKKKVTNEDMQLFGINCDIGIINPDGEIINRNDDYYHKNEEEYNDTGFYDVRNKKEFYLDTHLNDENILSAIFLKENVRRDSKGDVGLLKDDSVGFSQRFFYKPKQKYLNENDWGMAPYGAEKDVENIENFKDSTVAHFRQVLSNLDIIASLSGGIGEIIDKWLEENTSSSSPDWSLREENREEFDRLYREHQDNILKGERYAKNMKTKESLRLLKDPEVLKLVFEAVPSEKFFAETKFKKYPEIESIVRKNILGMTDDDKVKYIESEDFNKEAEKHIFKDVYKNENLGGRIIAFSDSYKSPIIFNTIDDFNSAVKDVLQGYRIRVKKEIIDSQEQNDPKFWGEYQRIMSSDRGGESPYAFGPEEFYEIYKDIKNVGPEVFSEIVPDIYNDSKYYNSPQTESLLYFYPDISWMDKDRIKKELWHAKSLQNSGILEYFYEKNNNIEIPVKPDGFNFGSRGEGVRVRSQRNDESDESYAEFKEQVRKYKNDIAEQRKNFLNWKQELPIEDRKKILFDGKQMHWISRMIRGGFYDLNKPKPEDLEYEEEKWFYQKRSGWVNNVNDWSQFNLEGLDVEKIKSAVEKNGNILFSFMDLENGKSDLSLQDIIPIIDLMNEGVDMRGVALAFDKKAYAEYILSGNFKNTLEEVLKTWPEDLKNNVKKNEFELYWEYANDYLVQDPKGMVRYAEFVKNNPKVKDIIDGEISKKSFLDFRLALSTQTDEVVNWYLSGAEYVGNETMQNYFMRFNTTRESNNKYADFHDALYWIESIKNVGPGEARSLLVDVDTVDEARELKDFITRYSKDKDVFIKDGEMKSIRELKKRVMAIESNIDLSEIDSRVLDITSAPGFNLRALEDMNKKQEFKDLIDGKYDQEQPFVPHKKLYTQTPLESLLKKGLGSWKDKIQGEANNPKKLFSEVNNLIKGRLINVKNESGIDVERKLEIKDLFENIPEDLNEEIINLLKEQFVNVGSVFEAEVMAKSNPEGWVCGDYTDCCMSFGNSNNNDVHKGYMFNKGTQYFTIKLNNRIIAQSVIVDSIDNKDNSDVIILDNIEVAPNYTKNSPMLSKIYNEFWNDYTDKPVKIGTGYSDLTPVGATLEPNNYSHKESLLWSDSKGSKIFNLLKTNNKFESIENMITMSNIDRSNIRDIVKMEEIVYPDGVVQGKSQVEEVIEKQKELEIPGAASSFVVRKGKENAGYLLMLPEKSKIDGKSVIHINDMVVVPKFQNGKISREMLKKVFDIAKAYRESEGVEGIEFEARESTSYALLNNPRIQKWIKTQGFKMTSNELLPEYLDGEDYYYVRLDFLNEG